MESAALTANTPLPERLADDCLWSKCTPSNISLEMDLSIIKKARDCFTKQSWESLLFEHATELAQPTSSKVLPDLFRLLRSDAQSLQYEPEIWGILLDGALACWNLDLANEIASFVRHLPSPKIALRVARVEAENGQPALARQIATKALRLSNLSSLDHIQLEMLICQSYVDEGNRNMAIRQSNRMQLALRENALSESERGQFLQQLGRTNFFLGRYPQAGSLFHDAYQLFMKIENWYEAARSIYNAGSSYFSAGGKMQEPAFKLIEKCRRICEAHQLQGPLSHVEAFYGHDDYWHGNFAGARDHYRRAHRYIPSSDKSFRTLHVLSMLTFVYLRTGQWTQAKRFGDKTLALAVHDHSERFRSRYHNLRAELMWEKGEIEESHSFLRQHVNTLITRGVNTLEELSTLSRFIWQCSTLSEDVGLQRFKISDQLRKNTGDWVEYLYASARLHLGCGRAKIAREHFHESLLKSRQYGDQYHTSLSLLGIIQSYLAENEAIAEIERALSDFEISLAKLVETPIKIHVHFIRAAISYRQGDFDRVRFHLLAANDANRISYSDRLALDAWLATINGHSHRTTSSQQGCLVGGLTKIYFDPSIKNVGSGNFLVSERYGVNLQNHPALNDILVYMLQRNKFQASPADIQTDVWKQSVKQQGWRQKIRNSIARLRELIPYTMAPLIIHDDHIELNSQTIRITPMMRMDAEPRDEILRLLSEGPMSTANLSNRLRISSATTKRILQRLTKDDRITVIKLGRQVVYQAIGDRKKGTEFSSSLVDI